MFGENIQKTKSTLDTNAKWGCLDWSDIFKPEENERNGDCVAAGNKDQGPSSTVDNCMKQCFMENSHEFFFPFFESVQRRNEIKVQENYISEIVTIVILILRYTCEFSSVKGRVVVHVGLTQKDHWVIFCLWFHFLLHLKLLPLRKCLLVASCVLLILYVLTYTLLTISHSSVYSLPAECSETSCCCYKGHGAIMTILSDTSVPKSLLFCPFGRSLRFLELFFLQSQKQGA